MTRHSIPLGAALLLTWGVLGGLSAARGQDNADLKVHTLRIYNGSVLTVYYSGKGMSEDEESALEELERAQNDLAQALQDQATAGQPSRTTKRSVHTDWVYSYPNGS